MQPWELFAGDVTLLYPFYYTTKFEILENGWLAFTPSTEYAKYQNCGDWRVSRINQDHRVSAFIAWG